MKRHKERGCWLWLVVLSLFVVCGACATPEAKKGSVQTPTAPPAGVQQEKGQEEKVAPTVAPPTPVKEETYYIHTVKWPGESLSIIAAWYTGDLQNWKVLAEANPDINPNKVFERMKIKIPESIMNTKAPMTKEHVDSFYPKPKKAAPRPAAPPPDDEPKLFGPKGLPSK